MIKILEYTHNPLEVIGVNASVCYNTPVKDDAHASRIAKHCINSQHGRNLEFADLTIECSGYSSRMIRELFRHVVGTSFLQSSTRYITYSDFEYIIPKNITEEAKEIYIDTMIKIQENYKKLKDLGVENDITGYILPLAMDSTFIVKINARSLENMANQRLCNRALEEYRDFMKDFKVEICKLDEEWKWISDTLLVPKCVKCGYCTEGKAMGCGLYETKKVVLENARKYKELNK